MFHRASLMSEGNKYKVDDNIEERLTEYHQHDERDAHQAAEKLRAQVWTTELCPQHERIP